MTNQELINELRRYASPDFGGSFLYKKTLLGAADMLEKAEQRYSKTPLHICGLNGEPCRGELTHEEVMKIANLKTTPIKIAFGQGRYQGYRDTRNKYEKILDVMDERLRHWKERTKSAEGELAKYTSPASSDLDQGTATTEEIPTLEEIREILKADPDTCQWQKCEHELICGYEENDPMHCNHTHDPCDNCHPYTPPKESR